MNRPKLAHHASIKGRQIVGFFRHTRTPLALTLDALKLKRAPFAAVTADGLTLSLKPGRGESFTFYENLVLRDYLDHGISLRPGDTVVDIGANIGSFTVLAGSLVGPSGRVLAFEPIGEVFTRLEGHVRLNCLDNVTCRRAAVDARGGTIRLQVDPKSALSTAHGDPAAVNGPTEAAPCVTLGQIFEEHRVARINLLKVDCEGSEYGIVETLTPDLAARIDQIAMEVHPVRGLTLHDLVPGLVRDLRALGFEVRLKDVPPYEFQAPSGPRP